MKASCCTIIIVVFFSCLASLVGAETNNEELSLSLVKVLEEFRNTNNLSSRQLLQILAETTIRGAALPRFGKGGIGVIRDSIYVETGGDKNAVIINNIRWTGRDKTDCEVVFAKNGKVLSEEELKKDADVLNMIFIRFEPQRIYFMDFKAGYGAYYLRAE